MAFYPDYYDVKRGDLTNPDYATDYDIPLVDKEDYDKLIEQSHKVRQDKIAKAEDNYKKINTIKKQDKPGMVFSSPDLQKRYQDLQESMGITDANYSAAINGGSYMMRKLEAAHANLSNSQQYWDIFKEDQMYREFKKNADKIEDPNLKRQAYASMAAFELGEPDPATGKRLQAKDLNLGDYVSVDLEKDISNGLKSLLVPGEVTKDKGGYQEVVKVMKIDKPKATDWFNAYMSTPAIQRNLVARGLGLNSVDETGKSHFALNETGQRWMENLLEVKTTPIEDVQSIKFNTKEFNSMGSKAGGFVLDDLATASTTKQDNIIRQGDQNVLKYNYSFDEDMFYKQVNLKLQDPDFRKKMIDQGFINEKGDFTDSFKNVVDVYKKKGSREEVKSYKNAPSPRSSSKGGGKGSGDGEARIRSAFKEAGLDYIGVGGLDLSKKVNYRVVKSGGKYYLRVGASDNNDIPLSDGKNYKVSDGSVPKKNDNYFKDQNEKQFGPQGGKSKWSK